MLSKENLPASRVIARGAFLCLLITLLGGCDSKEETADWPEQVTPVAETQMTRKTAKPVSRSADAITMMVYNLRNYLSMPRGGKDQAMRPKPEVEITALVEHIVKVSPDILGICEIGNQADLQDLTSRLRSRGLAYPHSHLHGGADPYRRLAILSKYPLSPHNSANLHFRLDGKRHKMLRGILDVEVDLPLGQVRLLGVHLKSKRPSKHWDQARLRRHEAHQLKKHIDSILSEDPSTQLLVYGDFNDTKQSSTVRALTGSSADPMALRPVDFRAKDGSRWTHWWAYEDVYSRFDYVFVSSKLKPRVELNSSYILELPQDDPASDHRPLVLTLR